MNTMMGDRLQEAMQRADHKELDEEIGEAVIQIAAQRPPAPGPAPKIDPKEERQRIEDALRGDLDEVANRHRLRLGRRVCSAHDARVKRIAFEHFNQMAGPEGGADNDPTWRTNAPPEATSD